MSFGFAIGDFIAAAKLANSLYRDVYMVARKAPDEVRILMGEIALLSKSIDLLFEEVKNPESALAKAGDARVEMANLIIRQTNLTLKDLELFAKKHDLGALSDEKQKLKQVWNRIKYARKKSSIDELRARVQYHNGTINLLLTAAGNSSLERMVNFQKDINSDIGGVKAFLEGSAEMPVVSMINEEMLRLSLSQTLMEKAECGQSWRAIGFQDWLQAGKWWLLKYQTTKETAPSLSPEIPPQRYADLLKASWILIDIISKHPQLTFWSRTADYIQVKMLAQTLHSELDTIKRMGLVRPEWRQIEQANLNVWVDALPNVSLQISATDTGFGPWKSSGEVIYFQSFGFARDTNVSKQSIECLVLVLVNDDLSSARLVVQTAKGFDLWNIQLNEIEGDIVEDYYRENEGPSVRIKSINNSLLLLSSFEERSYFFLILEAVAQYVYLTHITKDHRFLKGLIVLKAVSQGDEVAVARSLRFDERVLQPITYQENSNSEEIWSLAVSVATAFLGDDKLSHIRSDSKWDDRTNYRGRPSINRYRTGNWLYPIFYILSLYVHSTWIIYFDKSNFNAFDESVGYSPTMAVLISACSSGDEKMVEVLLKSSLDVNAQKSCLHPLHPWRTVLDRYRTDVTTALREAFERGHVGVVRALMDQGATVDEIMLKRALHANDPEEMLKRALHPYNPEEILQRALHAYDPEEMLKLVRMGNILMNLDIDVKFRLLCYVATFTMGYDNLERVEMVLRHGLSVKDTDKNGRTIIHWAVKREYFRDSLPLLIRIGADVNAEDLDGFSPLYYAIWHCEMSYVKDLLEEGAKTNVTSKTGKTLLHALSNTVDVSKSMMIDFLELFADSVDFKAVDNDGFTAPALFRRHGKRELALMIEQWPKCLKEKGHDDMATGQRFFHVIKPKEQAAPCAASANEFLGPLR